MQLLITGGAGFIGSNYAARAIRNGHAVTIFDNLSRRGVRANLDWLRQEFGEKGFRLIEGDTRDYSAVQSAVQGAEAILHLAAQVAVTSSVLDPRNDFDINVQGTINVLEAARHSEKKPILLFSSTNKVYGGLEELPVVEKAQRYDFADGYLGVSESQPLDFHSPYGCSKGSADQYVRDYARIYGMPTAVFRLSCIYGPHQFGMEDQGWVAWFLIKTMHNHDITIYGDGKQVRDLLFIEDLLDAFDSAIANPDKIRGEIFNLGGGQVNSVSIWHELEPHLKRLLKRTIVPKWADWRPGDQRIYVSDTSKAERILSWKPKISVEEGVTRLHRWISENHEVLQQVLAL